VLQSEKFEEIVNRIPGLSLTADHFDALKVKYLEIKSVSTAAKNTQPASICITFKKLLADLKPHIPSASPPKKSGSALKQKAAAIIEKDDESYEDEEFEDPTGAAK
jgi:hypothetical protein